MYVCIHTRTLSHTHTCTHPHTHTHTQIISFRKNKGNVRSMFMNSFSTSADTKEALKANPDLLQEGWEVVQNKVLRVAA